MPPLKKFTFDFVDNPAIKIVIEAYDEDHAKALLQLFIYKAIKL